MKTHSAEEVRQSQQRAAAASLYHCSTIPPSLPFHHSTDVSCKGYPSEPWGCAASDSPLSGYTQLISGCLCHGLEMTGVGSPSPWQATAQITPQPERANALLMNNKSTLITNCQPNQVALRLFQTERAGTAVRHYGPQLACLGTLRSCCSISTIWFLSFFFRHPLF